MTELIACSEESERSTPIRPYTVADPGFAKGGGHGERAEREPKRGSGGGAPSGAQGLPLVGVRSPPEAESFLYTKKWPKVKDLSENLPPCLSRAAKASPKFWSMGGGGRPDRP